jgi:AcrR family transcriptional regulator
VTNNTRDRLIGATAELFRRQGYTGTGVKQIVEAAGAPFGSMYHFFPDGKEALGAETIRWSGAMYGQLIDLFYEPGADPAVSTRKFFEAAADTVRDTDYADACPIATVALEVASTSETLRAATAEVFESWLAAIDTRLVQAGLTKAGARTAGRAAAELVRAAVEQRSAQVSGRRSR